MGCPGCFASLGRNPPLGLAPHVDYTRTQIHHEKVVGPVISRKARANPAYFLVLINNLYWFIHEMTANPCQR